MRSLFSPATILAFLISINTSVNAQSAKIGCIDKDIRAQAEQIKHDFRTQGLEVFKDAMLSMTPKEPYPVAVPLEQGKMYQLIFIGSKDASKIYFELFNEKDHKLVEKTLDDPEHSNFIVYSFIPQTSDIYLIVITQKIKGRRETCGSFTIMQNAGTDNNNR